MPFKNSRLKHHFELKTPDVQKLMQQKQLEKTKIEELEALVDSEQTAADGEDNFQDKIDHIKSCIDKQWYVSLFKHVIECVLTCA